MIFSTLASLPQDVRDTSPSDVQDAGTEDAWDVPAFSVELTDEGAAAPMALLPTLPSAKPPNPTDVPEVEATDLLDRMATELRGPARPTDSIVAPLKMLGVPVDSGQDGGGIAALGAVGRSLLGREAPESVDLKRDVSLPDGSKPGVLDSSERDMRAVLVPVLGSLSQGRDVPETATIIPADATAARQIPTAPPPDAVAVVPLQADGRGTAPRVVDRATSEVVRAGSTPANAPLGSVSTAPTSPVVASNTAPDLSQGVETPSPPRSEREDAQMQLNKPTRTRMFPAGLIAAQIAGVDAEAETPVPRDAPRGAILPQDRTDRPALHQSQPAPMRPEQPEIYDRPAPGDAPVSKAQIAAADLPPPPMSPPAPAVVSNAYAVLTPQIAQPVPMMLEAPAPDARAGNAALDGEGVVLPLRDSPPPQVQPSRMPDSGLPPRADHVTRQIVQIAQTPGMHRQDVQLNPQELGHVRLSLQSADQVMHVMITVERPETLDLMRRHIDQLFQQFRGMGYQDVTFSFSQDGRMTRDSAPHDPPQEVAPDPESEVAETAASPTPRAPTGQLDLRV